MNNNRRAICSILAGMMMCCFSTEGFAQAELAPWGNLTGIRMDGQLMDFETSLVVADTAWTKIKATGKEKQRPHYSRSGNTQIVTTKIDSIHFMEAVTDSGKGAANLLITARAGSETDQQTYFSWTVPSVYDTGGMLQADEQKPVPILAAQKNMGEEKSLKLSSLHFTAPGRRLMIRFTEPTEVFAKNLKIDGREELRYFVRIHSGKMSDGDSVIKQIYFKTSGNVDKTPATLTLDVSTEGRPFIGFGGNFRLQNPKADPQVIDYCLENMRVAFGRVEMPWRFWQPQQSDNPLDSAMKGRIHPAVEKAMIMAQRLGKKGMPIILSAWFPPAWAVVGEPQMHAGEGGVWGNPLQQSNAAAIYKSIGDYIVCLKNRFGVQIDYFSFNESDLGINVRQTAEEHYILIKGLGAYFEKAGLKTKMLLGDNSDATSYTFIDSALNDPAAKPYIGAISFHSWRGWDRETLLKWKSAADRLDLPLIVGEGSIDAQAWGYPAIFEEPTYAREEISLYLRLLAICQPASILQWQLTSDYSPLSGGGVFGDTTRPLRPTQRFWNLKQLASTPADLKFIPVSLSNDLITAAALGNKEKDIYSIQLVNNGPGRKITIKGLPASLKTLRVVITDQTRSMQEGKAVALKGGSGSFMLESGTYTTLTGTP